MMILLIFWLDSNMKSAIVKIILGKKRVLFYTYHAFEKSVFKIVSKYE